MSKTQSASGFKLINPIPQTQVLIRSYDWINKLFLLAIKSLADQDEYAWYKIKNPIVLESCKALYTFIEKKSSSVEEEDRQLVCNLLVRTFSAMSKFTEGTFKMLEYAMKSRVILMSKAPTSSDDFAKMRKETFLAGFKLILDDCQNIPASPLKLLLTDAAALYRDPETGALKEDFESFVSFAKDQESAALFTNIGQIVQAAVALLATPDKMRPMIDQQLAPTLQQQYQVITLIRNKAPQEKVNQQMAKQQELAQKQIERFKETQATAAALRTQIPATETSKHVFVDVSKAEELVEVQQRGDSLAAELKRLGLSEKLKPYLDEVEKNQHLAQDIVERQQEDYTQEENPHGPW